MPSKVPRLFNRGQWQEFEYKWMLWVERERETCR